MILRMDAEMQQAKSRYNFDEGIITNSPINAIMQRKNQAF
jgi:hypothetical protein